MKEPSDDFDKLFAAFQSGVSSLPVNELAKLNSMLLARVVEAQGRYESERKTDMLACLAAMPHILSLRVANELAGRLIDDPVSWQRVERLMLALPDADREKLLWSLESRRGLIVRKSTADRRVREAKQRNPKKKQERLKLLALAKASHDLTGASWAELLSEVNQLAEHWGLEHNGVLLAYDSANNLRTAVNKARNKSEFKKHLKTYTRFISEHDASQDIINKAA